MTLPTFRDEVLRLALAPPPDGAPLVLKASTFEMLGHEVEIEAGATITTRLDPAGERVEAFDHRLPSPLADGRVHGELVLEGRVRASSTPRIRHGSLRVAPTASASAHLRYRLLRCVPGATPPKQAAQLLAASVSPPQMVSLSELEPCEVHVLTSDMTLELGLDMACGHELEIPRELCVGVPARLRLAATAAMRAWAGLELTDHLSLEVGRAGLLDPGRVRIRICRLGQSCLSTGAKLALEISLDARPATQALFDAATSSPGLSRVTEALGELVRFDGAVNALARGDFDTLHRQLGADAAEVVADFLGQDGVFATVTSTSAARALVDGARRLVVAVEGADGLVRSLWDRLVRAADLEPALAALDWISRLHGKGLGGSLEPGMARSVDLLQVLSGLDFESLVSGGRTAEQALEHAADLAAQAVELHRQLEVLPEAFRKRLDSYFRRTSLPGVLHAFDALSSPDALRACRGRFLARVAELVLDRAVADVRADDLERLKGWSHELRSILAESGPSSLDARLRAAVNRLEAALGFSAALEVDRLTRQGQLLDVELDPASPVAETVQRELACGDVAGAVSALFAAVDQAGPDDRLPFLLRDCCLTSRRARSTAASALSALVGLERRSRRRLTEAEVRVVPGADGASLERRARYAGGVLTTTRSPEGATTQLRAWLSWCCLGSTPDLAAPYDAPVEPELSLAVSRQGPSCTREELTALDALLCDLGFLAEPGRFRQLRDDPAVRLALTVRLPRRPFEALLVCLDREDDVVRQSWCRDFDNALHRWFSDPFVQRLDPFARRRCRLGATLAAVVGSPWYRSTCGRAQHELGSVPRCHGRSVAGPPYHPVLGAVTSRAESLRALGRLARRYRRAVLSPGDAELAEASEQAARAFSASSPLLWPNPMLLLWLVHARLCRKAPQFLELASGVASVRWKPRGGDQWLGPELMTLEHGLRVHPVGQPDSIYPV